jgi:histidyl-tRNA synthetase
MQEEQKKLSLEPYKGTRDFYPEEMFVQNYIFSKMRAVVQRYGYVEYAASILEETALYHAKSGEEIINEQTYSFTDRGGRDVTIRPEMTPTVARMVARKRKELAFPLRWYSIPNLFRYERPQRGRLREHWQLNVDMFGAEGVEADAEVVAIASDIMKAFGASEKNFEVRINSRVLVNFLLREQLGLSPDDAHKISKLIDRKAKMPDDEFRVQAQAITGERMAELMDFLEAGTLQNFSKQLADHKSSRDLGRVITSLQERGVTNVVFSPALMRGFDYYTGTVFEVFDVSPLNNRSLFGGGRYDDLVGIFGVDKVPGVGFGMGDVTMRDYLETYKLLPKYKSSTHIYLCRLDDEQIPFIEELANYLRQQGINTGIDYSGRKLATQIKTAERQGIPYIICVGEEEARTRVFKLKNLATHEEKNVKLEDLPATMSHNILTPKV